MGFLRKRVLRRFSILGRIADLVLVGGMALRFAQRRGWLNDDQIDRIGLAKVGKADKLKMGELAVGVAAAVRLLRRR